MDTLGSVPVTSSEAKRTAGAISLSHADRLLLSQSRIFEVLASGCTLDDVLSALLKEVELLVPGAFGAILFSDSSGESFAHGITRSLPESFMSELTCAVERRIVGDIFLEEVPQALSSRLLKSGIRSYWTLPVNSSQGRVLALLGLFFRTPRVPNAFEERYIEMATNTAALAIEREINAQASRESMERYRMLVETTNVIPWEADLTTWRFTYVGPQAVSVLGYPIDAWYQDNFWVEHLHPEDREKTLKCCRDLAACGQDHELEYRMLRADGSAVWLRDIVSVVMQDGKPIELRGFMFDLSAQKASEAEQLAAEQSLNQAKKLDAVGRLAGGVAHDLNNTLQAISGHLQLIRINSGLSERGQRSIELALKSCDHASELIRGLLAFTRQGTYEVKEVALRDIVERTLELLHNLMGDCVKIKFTGDTIDARVLIDSSQIQQVLAHLVINALDAMPNGGILSFDMCKAEIADVQNFNPAAQPGAYVKLAVSDSGHGIAPPDLENIFDPFFTTKAGGHRQGLGLSVVYGAMQSHRGWVTVSSELDQGTTFNLYFPAAQDKAPNADKFALKSRISAQDVVMVIDDEEILVELAKEFLSRAGFEVYGFTDPQEAVSWYRNHYDHVDLIVLDMRMPGMNGKACFEAIKSIDPAASVVIASGYAEDEAVHGLLVKGALRYFSKPLHFPEFVAALREILELNASKQISSNPA